VEASGEDSYLSKQERETDGSWQNVHRDLEMPLLIHFAKWALRRADADTFS
jgi:hypothetical protein